MTPEIKRKPNGIKRKPRGRPLPKGNKVGPRFPPGVSGNPSGRPKQPWSKAEVTKLAGQLAPAALEMLGAAVKEAPWASRITAAKEILERAVAWPSGTIESKPEVNGVEQITLESLTDKELAEELRARAAVLERIAEEKELEQEGSADKS